MVFTNIVYNIVDTNTHTHTHTHTHPHTHWRTCLPACTVSCHSHVRELIKRPGRIVKCLCIKNKITVIIIFMSFHVPPLPLFLFSSSLLSSFPFLLESTAPCLVSWMPEVTDGDFLVCSPQLLNAEKVNSSCAYRPHFNHQGCIPAPVF